jgi:Tfp pilus assembly protein PilN
MKYKINLFPPKEQNIVDRAIYFSFHYLRYILVITQIIVIGVFFYRFKIDQEIVDLKDVLAQKQEIVAVSAPLIREVKKVEQKIAEINTIVEDQTEFQRDFAYLLSVFPEKLTLDKLSIYEDGKIEVSGITNDPSIVRAFYERLKKDAHFPSVELQNLKRDKKGFAFFLTLKPVITKAKTTKKK